MFYLKYRCNLFGNDKKVVYRSWVSLILAFEMQGKEKQFLATSCAVHISMFFFSALFITVNSAFFYKKKTQCSELIYVNVNSKFFFF